MSGAELGPLLLAAITFAVMFGLRQHHERKKLELRQEHAQFAGWAKLHIRMSDEVWECPQCSLPCFSWKAVEHHQDPAGSACAWFQEHAEELNELLARVRAHTGNSADDGDSGGPEGVTGWHVSATMEAGPEEPERPPAEEIDGGDQAALEQFENRAEAFRALMSRINKP